MQFVWVTVRYRQTPSVLAASTPPPTHTPLFYSYLSLQPYHLYMIWLQSWRGRRVSEGRGIREGRGRGRRGSPQKFVLWDWAEAGTRAASGHWSSGKVKSTAAAEQEELPRESASRRWQRGGSDEHGCWNSVLLLPSLHLIRDILSNFCCQAWGAATFADQSKIF